MKKYKPYLLFLLCCTSCLNDPISSTQTDFTIKGGKIVEFEPSSRSTPTYNTLPEGSTITFYSQGGLLADEVTLTYNGSSWEGDFQKQWENPRQEADVTAFYPPLYRNETSFYKEGFLCDQLWSHKSYRYGDDIILSFNHLFAQIKFQLSTSLNQQISQIEFIPSLSVSDISPESGTIFYKETENPVLQPQNEAGEYTFLIPPASLSLRIRFHTTEGSIHESILDTYSFSSGHEYVCPVKLAGEEPGISNVKDFIAFTHLINGEEYENRSLEEFGREVDGNMIYYLQNDLTFTPEESALVQMIGKYSSTSSQKRLFDNTFDGQGHKLSNLRFEKPVAGSYYSGLFSGVSATGTVKNLILEQAVYNNPDDTDKASFLAGVNKGKIENCRIQNCTIEDINKTSEFGNISSRNEGTIINCHVDNIYLKKETSYGNGITRYNVNGKIMNCAVTNCNFNKATSKSGLICNKSQNGEIQNCYLKGNSGNYYAISLQAIGTNIIRCCFYPQTDTKEPVGSNYVSSPSDSLMKYGNKQAITEADLPHVLNLWVKSTGPQLHSEFSFLLWEKGETLPAILVSP